MHVDLTGAYFYTDFIYLHVSILHIPLRYKTTTQSQPKLPQWQVNLELLVLCARTICSGGVRLGALRA